MKTRTTLLVLLLLCCFFQPLVAADSIYISLVQLIANPRDYDGKVVHVIGFMRLEFDGTAIYLHQDDYKHYITKNGLWIDVPKDLLKKKDEFNQKYVIVGGTFSAKETGRKGLWSGSIQKVSKVQVWVESDGKDSP